VVLCTGADTRACEAWLGADTSLPVEPVRGQILSLDGRRLGLERIVWGAGAYLVPKRDGSLVVGATSERVGHDCRVTAEGLRQLLDAARDLLPGIAECSFLGAWAGLRPDTPDHLPMIGPAPGTTGLSLACGHYRNGVLLAPLTSELVTRGILGKGWADAAAFDPGRFC
jgi:glycine oxidase